MVLTLVPINGGKVKNFQLVGDGGSYDNVKCIFKQGTWVNNKLNGTDARVTNYLSATVNIRQGVYQNGVENGIVLEYVFPKTSWDEFITNPEAGIDSTRYTQTFSAGVWVSTSETLTEKKIKGLISLNSAGNIEGFTFSEV